MMTAGDLDAQWTTIGPTGLLAAGTVQINVGTNGAAPSLLTVSGHQLGSGEVFRTQSNWGAGGLGFDSHWRMYRATAAGVNNFGMEIGEIFCRQSVAGDLNTNRGFSIQAKRFNGSLWLRNHRGRPNYDAANQVGANDEPSGNGLRLIDDSTRVGGGLTLNTYNRISRIGYVAIGHAVNMDQPAQAGEMIMPWTRLHLVEGLGWPGETAYPVDAAEWNPYRPYCRNGVSCSGNSTYAYLGQKYALRNYPGNDDLDDLLRDSTDFLALWGNNRILPGGSHWNNFSFRFSLAPDGVLGSASDFEGLEIMRLRPHQAEEGGPVEGFVGIGDYVNNFPEVPEERLDVLDRTIRIRSMGVPGLYQNDGLNRVLVVDPADGRVHWRDASSIGSGGGSGCNWTYVPGANRMYTAYDPVGPGSCPQADWRVGIGASVPATKLDVYSASSLDNSAAVIRGILLAGTGAGTQSGVIGSIQPEVNGNVVPLGIGVDGRITGVGAIGYGVRGRLGLSQAGNTTTDANATIRYVDATTGTANRVCGARGEVQVTGTTIDRYAAGTYGLVNGPTVSGATLGQSFGMYGESYARGTITDSYGGYGISQWISGSSVSNSYGLRGRSASSTSGLCTNSFGVHGYAGGAANNFAVFGHTSDTLNNTWAGFFQGKAQVAGNLHVTGVIVNSSDAALKTNVQDIHNGLALVTQLHPKRYDFQVAAHPSMRLPSGTQIGLLAPEVQEILPELVVPSYMPQMLDSLGNEISPAEVSMAVNYIGIVPLLIGAVQEQQSTIQSLQETVAQMQEDLAACCADGAGQRGSRSGSDLSNPIESDLRIIPNPVVDRTELRYSLGEPGRVRLEITDASGRTLQVQDEGYRLVGSFVFVWTTDHLAPGTYYCALHLNDVRLVEKSVKLGR